ncbi:hypothetical protein ACFLZ7_03200 [Nanoarchaeota archaeon]
MKRFLVLLLVLVAGCTQQGVHFENYELNEIFNNGTEHHEFVFDLVNDYNYKVTCDVFLEVTNEGEKNLLYNKSFILEPMSAMAHIINFTMPPGDSDLELRHSCE